MYQDLFNNTLSKIRLVLLATGNQDLMKAIAKIMFDFSDELKDKDLIKDKDKEKQNEKRSV
jgi:hypothetical protein